ncbi:MAG: RnfABCDGE type electron transport complex subunit D [Clostridiales bacterium]|nr:RnfABCDGE type electron transport complex subunit D [Clostridiales bacterium]
MDNQKENQNAAAPQEAKTTPAAPAEKPEAPVEKPVPPTEQSAVPPAEPAKPEVQSAPAAPKATAQAAKPAAVKAPAYNLTVSVSPHAHSNESTRSIMLDVIIALLPALIGACVFFGMRSLMLCAVSAAACVFFEWAYRKVMKLDCTVGDLSAIVTGLLLAFVCPVTTPYWCIIIGDFFAIIIVKQLFGGIGQNFMNPALAGRAFMFSWPVIMSTWVVPGTTVAVFGSNADATTAATAMSYMHNGLLPDGISLMELFIGNAGGCLGETSFLLLLIGGIYLVIRKVITPTIPVAYIATVAVLTFLFPMGNDNVTWMAYQLFGGGLALGAIFMATDYVTSPVTKTGQLIYGIACGLLTVFIRYFGSYPEGVSYAIIIMNCCVFLIDKIGRPKRFGLVKEAKEGGAK